MESFRSGKSIRCDTCENKLCKAKIRENYHTECQLPCTLYGNFYIKI